MKTLFIGQKIITLDEVESTNAFARELLHHQQVLEGTVIIAKAQTSGKGQRGNEWLSEPGKNITLSIILNPQFITARDNFMLNKIASLAVLDFLSFYPTGDVAVKWPNDVYIHGKKVAGILIENFWRENKLTTSIIGIGININQEEFGELSNATSLKAITGTEHELSDCVEQLCRCVEARYLQLRSDRNHINNDYIDNLWGLGQKRKFRINNVDLMATIKGVNREGQLVLESGETLLQCDLKEVVFVP